MTRPTPWDEARGKEKDVFAEDLIFLADKPSAPFLRIWQQCRYPQAGGHSAMNSCEVLGETGLDPQEYPIIFDEAENEWENCI